MDKKLKDAFAESLKKLAEVFKDDEPNIYEWLDLEKIEDEK